MAGRGFVITLTDSKARTVSTPPVSLEDVYRALGGQAVEVRNGGFAVELTPEEGNIRIGGGPLAGLMLEGTFTVEAFRAAILGAGTV